MLLGIAAEVAVRQRKLQKAVRLTADAFDDVDLTSTDVFTRDALHTGYEVYRALGDDKRALAYLEAYQRVDDQARSVAASTSAALMAARFDYANQNLKIAQRDATIATASAKLRDTVLQGVGIAGSVIFGLLLFGYISIRRSRDQVRAANDDLSTTNVALEKALAARTEFLAMTSHEIRTPLNGILGMTQVLLADRKLDVPVRSKVELVQNAGETMKALVDDLLDVAKMSNGEIVVYKEPMQFGRLLRDASQIWSGQAQTRGIALVLDIGDAPERIVEDQARLQQIVFNLMSNAIKFTDHGEVRLEAAAIADGSGGERLRVTVTDSGIGIPADKLEDIFESFRQVDAGKSRRFGGTGLGLSICRSLARAMGGDVSVSSVLDVGSTFTLDLPLERVDGGETVTACEDGVATLECARLLLVEANPLVQSVLRAVLSPQVRSFEVAASLDEAAARLDRDPIDLLLADGATLGLDLAVAARLRAAIARGGGRMALLWPAPDEALRIAAQAAGLDHVIGKPIAAADLVVALKTIYATATASADLATQAA